MPLTAFSQSNDVITEILESPEVTYGQICYLSAVEQGFVGESASYEEVIQVLYEKGQLPELVNSNEPIALVNLAYIYTRLWNVKGGLLFRLTKGSPRYALKQLKADAIVDSNWDPTMKLTGEQALNLYTSCLYYYGKQTLEIE